MKRITISNLKDIKTLNFDIPWQKGGYLIAGANGCGKTTLLVCLERICNSLAFALGFTSCWMSSKIDQVRFKYKSTPGGMQETSKEVIRAPHFGAVMLTKGTRNEAIAENHCWH